MDVGLSKDLTIEQLRLLGEAIDSSPSPLTLYDQDYNIIYANKTSRSLWPELHAELAKGVGLEKAAYQAAAVLFPDAPDEVIQAAADYAVFTFNSPDAHEMKAGDGRWLKLSHHKIGDRAVAGIGFDITDLKNNEKAFKEAKAAQSKLIEVLEYGILVVDDNGLISLFNPAYQEYCRSFGFEITYGMHVKELTRCLIDAKAIDDATDLNNEEYNAWFQTFYETRFGPNHPPITEEFSLNDGRHILRHQNYRKLVGNIITITDITHIKNAQLKAEAAERSKSEFLANMSHEIRTPMNGVMGMAHLLSRTDLGVEENDYVKIIQRSSEALLTIINDILDFSKIEAGQVCLAQKPFNLRDSLEDVMALLSVAAREKDVELILQIQPDLPVNYIGDAGRLRQIITNIFGNAVKFTAEGHVLIQVTGERSKNEVNLSISIQDTGIGIPPDKLDGIFDKFAQADSSSTREHEGTGLGLSIAKQLVGLMGGDITAQSELGQGAEFTIKLSLPLALEQQQEQTEVNNFEGAKILIIDDNAINSQALNAQFKHWNCKSMAVNSVEKCLLTLDVAKKKNIIFDCVLLDYKTLEENGYPDFKGTPTIVFTSIVKDAQIKHLNSQGLNTYITKPFNPNILRDALNSIVKSKSQNSQEVIQHNPNIKKTSVTTTPHHNKRPLDILHTKTEEKHLSEIPLKALDILVVEDNLTNYLYIEYILKELGLSYHIVNNGQQAVDCFREKSPRLVLMDISMPVMNGYEATKAIRDIEHRHALTHTPIVALTAHALAGDENRCLKAGMDNYLTKPLSIHALQKVLKQWNIINNNVNITCETDEGMVSFSA